MKRSWDSGSPPEMVAPAARLIVEDAVFLDLGDDLGDGRLAAGHGEGFVHAGLGAFAAQVAFGPVDDDGPPSRAFGDGLPRTDGNARIALGTAGGPDHEVGAEGDPLGIVAPEAVEGAALEEDGRPDARAVMDGEVLDIKYEARVPATFFGAVLAGPLSLSCWLIYQISDCLSSLCKNLVRESF